MTEKEKLLETLKVAYEPRKIPQEDGSVALFYPTDEDVADMIEAAVIDEYKHRSEVAEKERDEWKERAEKAENTLKEWVKCISPLQSAGFTINPLDVLRDSTKCVTIAQRALENIIKQYWCDNRGCSECEEKQGCIEEICSRYIQQAEREIEEGKI